MTGTEFDAIIKNLIGPPREKAILDAVRAGNVPKWYLNTWIPVKSGRATLFVKPDYLPIGTDDNYRRMPMTPQTAQQIATMFNAILPSRKIVNLIYEAAPHKVFGNNIPPDAKMETSQRFAEHDVLLGKLPTTELVAGHKKDIVVGPDLDGSRVAIYGWKLAKWPHQDYSTVHGSYYADYAHGVRLVSRMALLDGAKVDVMQLFRDPSTVALVSDQGNFVPLFPSKGAKWPSDAAGKPGALEGAAVGALAGAAIGGPVGALVGGVVGAMTVAKK